MTSPRGAKRPLNKNIYFGIFTTKYIYYCVSGNEWDIDK